MNTLKHILTTPTMFSTPIKNIIRNYGSSLGNNNYPTVHTITEFMQFTDSMSKEPQIVVTTTITNLPLNKNVQNTSISNQENITNKYSKIDFKTPENKDDKYFVEKASQHAYKN